MGVPLFFTGSTHPTFHHPPPNKRLSPAALHEAVTDLNNALLHRKGPWTVARYELLMHSNIPSVLHMTAEAKRLPSTTRHESFRYHVTPSVGEQIPMRAAAGAQDKGRIFQDRSALAQARTSKSADRPAVHPRPLPLAAGQADGV